jgi:hypothetical protein
MIVSYYFSEGSWNKIKDFLPGQENHCAVTATESRLFVEACD